MWRNDGFTMFLTVLCLYFFVRAVPVLSEAPPAPPQNIHVVNWKLSWTPAPEEGNVAFTVQYNSYNSDDSDVWTDVSDCIRISANSCQFPFNEVKAEHNCVKLRVRAERNGLKSVPVEACSQNDGSCTPKVYSLTPRPGSLTVHLSNNHSLAYDHADSVQHRVYYGKEGELLKDFKDGVSSVTISGLEEGQRYCVRVQYVIYEKLIGLSTCAECELIPKTKSDLKQTGITVGVVLIVCVVCLIPAMVYVLLFQRERIKKCFKPPCEIPSHFLPESLREHQPPLFPSPAEEPCEVVLLVTARPQRSSGYEHRPPLPSAQHLLSADEM